MIITTLNGPSPAEITQSIHHFSKNGHVLSSKGERGDQTELPGAEADHSAHILTSVQTEANLDQQGQI